MRRRAITFARPTMRSLHIPSALAMLASRQPIGWSMAKNIVFCADGTWNGPDDAPRGDPDNGVSNVLKLFRALARDTASADMRALEQECSLKGEDGHLIQVAKYINGVGDATSRIMELWQGGTGAGLSARVVRGYTFISRNYQDGDRIVLVGFSRGAYTARALAGLIAKQGLLNPTKTPFENKQRTYRLGAQVWTEYRQEALDKPNSWLGDLQATITDPIAVLRDLFDGHSTRADRVDAPIKAVGVWDTVGSMGIPAFNRRLERIDLFQFADRDLSPSVEYGFHGTAIDELRADFTPTLWNPRERLEQVLFPGAHSDVGGGYPTAAQESGLANGALHWMMRCLSRPEIGVRFTDGAITAVGNGIDATAPQHEPWFNNAFLRSERVFPSGLAVSAILRDRLAAPMVRHLPSQLSGPYRPTNLGHYIVDGVIKPDLTVA